jgi:hypothetical protein
MLTEKKFKELAKHLTDSFDHLDLTTQYRIEKARAQVGKVPDYTSSSHRAAVMLNADLLGY